MIEPAPQKAFRSLDITSRGDKPEAVIVDMDGTLENWDGSVNDDGMAYVHEHHAAGRVIVIVTARDHETCYARTHRWLTEHLAVPFVGPFCRTLTDPRYASAFKQDVCERLSHLYRVIGAIDDNPHVLAMWREIGVDAVRTFDAPRPQRLLYDEEWLDFDSWMERLERLESVGSRRRRRGRKKRMKWSKRLDRSSSLD